MWVYECCQRGVRGGIYGRVSAVKFEGVNPLPSVHAGVDLNQLRSDLQQVLGNWNSFEKACGAVLPE